MWFGFNYQNFQESRYYGSSQQSTSKNSLVSNPGGMKTVKATKFS